MDPAVIVDNVGKTFRRYHADRPGTIQEVVAKGLRRLRSVERFWGLRGVSFEVAAGRTVGIIGSNGSGKSTLLRLVGGVGRPDTGQIRVRGRVGALLDLGAGFHPDLTGRENATLAGILSGLSRRQVLDRLDSIVEFAEVESAFDAPIRAYSSGMRMRLAFAVAVHAEPDVLLIDEVLSVGDIGFQRKCLDRIEQFKAAGCSILFVSHAGSEVGDLCDEAVWLNGGEMMANGPAGEVVREYFAHMGEPGSLHPAASIAAEAVSSRVVAPPPILVRTPRGEDVPIDEDRLEAEQLSIQTVRLLDDAGVTVSEIRSGQPLRIELTYTAVERLVAPIFCARILREDGFLCYDFNTEASELSFSAVHGLGRTTVHLDRVDLNSGHYVVDVACYAQDWAYKYDYRKGACSFIVRGNAAGPALLDTPSRWELDPGAKGDGESAPNHS
jgi:lipopolysaccharide transport system ATP-binding protein